MDLRQSFTYTFDVEQVICLRLFFKQGISKLGNGEFRDAIEKIYKDFELKLLQSQLSNDTPY